VDEETLKEAKAAMNLAFESNRLRPGDEGYVHDKRVAPPEELEENEWDDEIEDFDTEDELDPFTALLE